MTVLSQLLEIDRGDQYWNAANAQMKAAAGKDLLANIAKLDVFNNVLSKEGNETMRLHWDLFHAKVTQGIISVLKPIHDKRNALLSGLDKELSIGNDQIDDMLKDQLIDDFETVLPLSDFLHTPSNMLHDTDSLNDQRKTYIEMLKTMKTKDAIDVDLEKHSSKGKGKTVSVTPAASRQNTSSSSMEKDKATTDNFSNIQSQLKSLKENRESNKENKANAKDIKESKINAVKDLDEQSCYVNPMHRNEWVTFYLDSWGKEPRLDQFELLSEDIKLKYINRLRPLAAEGMKKLFQLN